MNITCPDCHMINVLTEMPIKMGGLLCANCRRILVWHFDPVFVEELKRRRELHEVKESK